MWQNPQFPVDLVTFTEENFLMENFVYCTVWMHLWLAVFLALPLKTNKFCFFLSQISVIVLLKNQVDTSDFICNSRKDSSMKSEKKLDSVYFLFREIKDLLVKWDQQDLKDQG